MPFCLSGALGREEWLLSMGRSERHGAQGSTLPSPSPQRRLCFLGSASTNPSEPALCERGPSSLQD